MNDATGMRLGADGARLMDDGDRAILFLDHRSRIATLDPEAQVNGDPSFGYTMTAPWLPLVRVNVLGSDERMETLRLMISTVSVAVIADTGERVALVPLVARLLASPDRRVTF